MVDISIRKLKEERGNLTFGTVFLASVATVILYGGYSYIHPTGSQPPGTTEPPERSTSTQEIVPDAIAREVYSMQIEEDLRKAGNNLRAEAVGGSHDTLQIKAGLELDDQGANSIMNGIFSNESLMTNLKSYGFKSVEVDSAPSKETWRGHGTWTRPLLAIAQQVSTPSAVSIRMPIAAHRLNHANRRLDGALAAKSPRKSGAGKWGL
jgi:hypothetical protein